MANEREKKERVIHTRVPESLDDEIKRHAGALGLSVSNLVRNVLQNAFGLVEDIVNDSAEIARAARGGPHRERPQSTGPAPQVLAWQSVLLNVNAVCEGCNAILAKGTSAGIGVVDGAGPKPIRCQNCLKEMSNDDNQS